MIKNFLSFTGRRIIRKLLKLAVIALISYITWEAVVKDNSLHEGKSIFNEIRELRTGKSEHYASPVYEMYSDSSYIYIKQR